MLDGYVDIDDIYSYSPKIQFDKGFLEKSDHLLCVNATFDWEDLGSFKSIYEVNSKDGDGNVIFGNCIVDGITNSLIWLNEGNYLNDSLDSKVIIERGDDLMISDL